MNKKIFIIFALLLVVSLIGCKDKKPETKNPVLTIEEEKVALKFYEQYTIVPAVTNYEGTPEYVVESGELTFEGLNYKEGPVGEHIVKVSLKGYPEVFDTIVLELLEAPKITIEQLEVELTVGDTYEVKYTTEKEEGYEVEVSIKNKTSDFISLSGNTVTAIAVGEGYVEVSLVADGHAVSTICVNFVVKEPDTEKPEFNIEGEEKMILNWGKTFDPLKGVTAVDNVDGDITEDIQVEHSVDNRTYGTYEVKYEVSDKAGNVQTITREVEVVWNYEVQFIGHMGCYYGVPNSEEAFIYAASVLKYQALECDVKQTKDGVFVVCHDDDFAGVNLANTNYEDLKDVVKNSSRTAGYPSQYGEMPGTGKYSSTICTLERYLQICKEYGVKAVVELKSSKGITSSDQSRMQALLDLIEECDMLNDVIFLGSTYNCLIWVKQNGYEYIPCQYLVNSCESETVFNRCLEYGFELSINAISDNPNSAEWIARYQDAGIKVSTWTFTQYVDYPELQKWIDMGVDYVTVDWHSMHKLNLPDSSEVIKHTVEFYDYDGTLLKETSVKDGRAAAIPSVPKREGYEFVGWSQPVNKVTSDLEVTAQYKTIQYKITYDDNLYIMNKSSWANKQEFTTEFYSDMFEWIKTKVESLNVLSYSNGVYTIKTNTSTNGKCSFSSVDDILALDLYVFEQTFGPLIYKPISGTNSVDYVPTVDENYFLNSEPYRTKYIEMNAYFYNAVKNGYSSYSSTFAQASNNRVQIMFRFHQWVKGTSIAAFDAIPNKYVFKYATGIDAVMPTDHVTYTIEDEVILSNPTASIQFIGWYLNRDGEGEKITSIGKGSTGDIILYAKWGEFSIPDVYSNISYELDGGTNHPKNVEKYLEGVSTTLYPAEKAGHVFVGWSLEEGSSEYVTSINEKHTGDVKLYANYEYAKYSITYDLQDGNWGNEITYNGSPVTSIKSTSNNDYWNAYASNIFLFAIGKYSGSLNATWSERIGIALDEQYGTYVVKAYSVSGKTFDFAGCDYILQISSSYSNYNGTKAFRDAVQLGQIVRFVGDPDSGIATIEFYNPSDISGVVIENFVSEYTIASRPILLPVPKYEGKTFKGWALDKEGTKVFDRLPEECMGNIVLYAIWE